MTDDPSIAAIDFPAVPGPLLTPNKFYVKVPKFYPHNGPVVQCVDIASYYPNHFFDDLGHVTHPLLTTQWTALYTLNTVVQVLREIREMLQTGKLYKMSYEDDSTMEEES
jgi:ubiquitin-protein ligase